MKIRSKIELSTIFSSIIIIGIFSILHFVSRQVERSNSKQVVAQKIIHGVFELNILMQDYLQHRTGRARIQWQNRHESVAKLLISEKFSAPEDAAIIEKIRSEHEDLRVIFSKLVRNYRKEQKLEKNLNLFGELDNRLIGQLLIESQEMVLKTSEIVKHTRSEFKDDRQREILIIIFSVIVLTVTIASLVFMVFRNVLKPITKLQLGTEIIGKGDLTHKIDASSEDEVGDLARAFNEMTWRLKESHLSLEGKVKQLERSNKDLEQFAYVASHDLQEPLRMVSNFTKYLSKEYKDKLDSQANEYIDFAVNGAVRMQNLIEDLLKYSRIGKTSNPFKKVDSLAVYNKAIDNLQMAINDSNSQITHDELPIIMGNDILLTQLFQNLIGNSIKYRSKEPPHVHVSARQKDNKWVFSVRDNGIGIDPKHFERIFKIFQRLHGQTEFSGTGIGLALCKKIVDELYGGKIYCESEPGKGATFYFEIPTS